MDISLVNQRTTLFFIRFKMKIDQPIQKIFLSLCCCFLFASCRHTATIRYDEDAVPPDQALSTFEVEPGFKIEMIAAEPLVSDPVDMEIDEYGRLYVVEMHGYPIDKNKKGTIVQLSDTDGDGVMDKRTIFLDELILPNGILRWKNGFIVTDAPNVYYIEDTDGDGKADKKEVLLTGFSLSNPHVNVNNPVFALDNWIYLAHFGSIGGRKYEKEFGDKGTEVYFPDQPDSPRLPKNADRKSVRFQLQNHQLEMTASRAQFGQTFDPWGHRILATNYNHAYHEVIDSRYLGRTSALLVSNAIQSISDHGDVSEIFQTTISPDRQLFSGVGVMTSSSGITAYTGGAFPAPFNDSTTFVCESVSNLVHADHLREDGSSFIASRMGRPNKEFLTSTDYWSRPVNMYIGPDGALYVLDYYRKIIEHPEWMSDEAVKDGGLFKGNNMGRIYRVSAVNSEPASWIKGLTLADASTAQLVQYLNHPNSWWRMNAQRLLLDRMDTTAIALLKQLAEDKEAAMGRLHARWTLEGMKQLSSDIITDALKDPVPGNRENAIKLAELHLNDYPGLRDVLIALQNDPNPRVRFQLLCTLGSVDDNRIAEVRKNMLFKDIKDPWIQVAAVSALSLQPESLLAEVIRRFDSNNPAYASLAGRLSEMIAATQPVDKISNLIGKVVDVKSGSTAGWRAPVIEGIANGIKRNDSTVVERLEGDLPVLIRAAFDCPDRTVREAAYHMVTVIGLKDGPLTDYTISRAVAIASDNKNSEEKRAEAFRFIRLKPSEKYVSLIESSAAPESAPFLQKEALKAYDKIKGVQVSQFVLKQWPFMTPEVREVALSTFMEDTARMNLLMGAIEKGEIQKTVIGWGRVSRLMSHEDASIRNRARPIFTRDDDKEVIKSYQTALELKGDTVKGKEVFIQYCIACHQKRDELGIAYGPDMGSVRNWLPKNILANILSPNLSIAAGFDLWELETKSGEKINGLLSSESSSAVTLLVGPGEAKTFNRQDIKTLKALNASAMTEGFAEKISHQEMADLISFLRE